MLVPLLAAATLAAHSPELALGAGGLTLSAATYYRKGLAMVVGWRAHDFIGPRAVEVGWRWKSGEKEITNNA